MRVVKTIAPLQLFSETEHTLIAGLPGQGKDMFGEGYITKNMMLGYKVFDINSESRGEGMYYNIKQTDSGFKSRIDFLTNGALKPQKYDDEIIMFLGHNLKKFNQLPSNIKLCVFNEQWLDNEDLKKFLAFNDSQVQLMEAIFELHGDAKLTLSYLYKFLTTAASNKMTKEAKALKESGVHYASVNTIKRRLRGLLRSGLFYNEENKDDNTDGLYYYLDLAKSLEQYNKITTFSTYLIEDPYIRYVCISTLLKKFIELIETRQSKVPVLMYIREANDFYYQESPEPYVMDIRNNVDKILRKGRFIGGSKITVVMNTQLLTDLPRSTFDNFNKFVCFKLPSTDSKLLNRKADIHETYLKKLAGCDVGMGMIIISGTFQYPIIFIPTLHKKSDPDFDVFRYLATIYSNIDYSKSDFLDLGLLRPEEKPKFVVS